MGHKNGYDKTTIRKYITVVEYYDIETGEQIKEIEYKKYYKAVKNEIHGYEEYKQYRVVKRVITARRTEQLSLF